MYVWVHEDFTTTKQRSKRLEIRIREIRNTIVTTATEMNLEVMSPEKVLFKGKVKSVGVPGKLGYMTILPGHAALIAELSVGELTFSEAESLVDQRYFVGGGFVEVRTGNVRVLVDVIERPADIDVGRADKALKRAEGRLSGKPADVTGGVDYSRALLALKKAQARKHLAALYSKTP